MYILTTYNNVMVGNNIFRRQVIGVQYFLDDEANKAHLMCNLANTIHKKENNGMSCELVQH